MSLSKEDLGDVRDIVIDALEALVLPRFDSLEHRMDRLEGRMDGLENRMGNLEVRMDGLEGRMGNIEGRMGSIEGRIGNLEVGQHEQTRQIRALSGNINNIDGRLEALEADIKELYAMVGTIQPVSPASNLHEVNETDQRMDYLERSMLKLAHHINVTL